MHRRELWLLGGVALVVVLLAVLALAIIVIGVRRSQVETKVPLPPPATSGAWYDLWFTTPQRSGVPPSGSSGRLDEKLVGLLDGSRRSIDMAIYDLGLENVAEALVRAKKRGVDVRVVTDTDNMDRPIIRQLKAAGIPVVDDQRQAIMHHKFAVIDGATLVTGAWNFAERDTFRHNNHAIVVTNPELARNFSNEFEKMFSQRKFGPTKPKDVPNPTVTIDGARIETRFASEGDVTPAIIGRINAARSSVAFMTFTFTDDQIGAALEQQARRGVGVWGVIETTGSETKFSQWGQLKGLTSDAKGPPFPGCGEGPPVVQDGNPFLLHHKVMVIDERTVILGSFNFTKQAAESNDEASLIIDDPRLARQFLEEFCRVYNQGVERAKTKRSMEEFSAPRLPHLALAT